MLHISTVTVYKFYPINTSLRALNRELAMGGDAVQSLLSKRAGMLRAIEQRQAELLSMRADLLAVESAIRLFDQSGVAPKR